MVHRNVLSGAMFYGAQVWDPLLILAQIVTLQCLFYLSLGALLFLFVGPWVSRLALEHCLDDRYLNFHSFLGWMVTAANVANALVAAVCLVFVVGRAKKCLDFAATLYLLHLAAVSAMSAIPSSFAWWAVNIWGMVLAAVLGEWLCLQRELQEIPIGGLGRRGRPAAVEMVRPPTAAVAVLARVQQAVGGLVRVVFRVGGRGMASAVPAPLPDGRKLGSGLEAIPEDIP
ncbi:hypothetical protein WJX81_003396 [Elliptochloris bilobata]|uniref:Protein SYS1 n=1 Tax=Elliptochloris bilobata TaxID=381761 RepID=A0AAW1RJZ7_9CHLO